MRRSNVVVVFSLVFLVACDSYSGAHYADTECLEAVSSVNKMLSEYKGNLVSSDVSDREVYKKIGMQAERIKRKIDVIDECAMGRRYSEGMNREAEMLSIVIWEVLETAGRGRVNESRDSFSNRGFLVMSIERGISLSAKILQHR